MKATKFNEHLSILHGQYLGKRKEEGGTASGWRAYGMKQLKGDPETLALFTDEFILMALTKKWQEPPRKRGPDLFSISGYVVPDTLTRVARTIEFVDGDDIEEDAEDKFEKVDHRYATVGDLVADSNIKLRKGSAIVRACKRLRIAADVALKRAKGKVDIHLCDIADKD